MDCWTVLNIEQFSDKKAIQVAYAKQLKLHRPDEDPEGFQAIHRAYKSALSWIPDDSHNSEWENLGSGADSFSMEEPSDDDLAQLVIESLQSSNEEIVANEIDQALLGEIREQEHMLSEDWQCLFSKVGAIIKSDSSCNNLVQWGFLESLASMNDLEFRKAASDQVFEVVSEVNFVSLNNNHLRIKRPVLEYLNQLFSWDKKWQEYQQIYSKKSLNSVYPYLTEADKP